MGPDDWPYGIERNRAELEAVTRYAAEQGLTDRVLVAAELFAPALSWMEPPMSNTIDVRDVLDGRQYGAYRFVVLAGCAAAMVVEGYEHLFTEGRASVTVLLWVAFICSLAGHYFLTSWLPTVLNGNGVSLAHAVVAGALIQAGGGVGSLLVGRLTDRMGTIAIAYAFVASIPFVILLGTSNLPEPLLLVLVTVAGLFLLGGQVGLNSLAATIYPTFVRASGAGWALGVGRIGSILGPVVGGVLIGAGLSTRALFLCAAIPGAASAVAVFALHLVSRGGGRRIAPDAVDDIELSTEAQPG